MDFNYMTFQFFVGVVPPILVTITLYYVIFSTFADHIKPSCGCFAIVTSLRSLSDKKKPTQKKLSVSDDNTSVGSNNNNDRWVKYLKFKLILNIIKN